MIKAVIFDVFGVLVTDGWHPFKHKYFKDDPEKNAEASRLIDLSTRGAFSYKEFLRQVSDLSGVGISELKYELSSNTANLQLFGFIKQIKPEFKIGLLSNAAENRLDKLFSPEQLEIFDATVLSCDVAANKPEARVYEVIAQKLGRATTECIFVDDIQRYVEGAEAVGMKGVLYKNPEQVMADIRGLIADMNN